MALWAGIMLYMMEDTAEGKLGGFRDSEEERGGCEYVGSWGKWEGGEGVVEGRRERGEFWRLG